MMAMESKLLGMEGESQTVCEVMGAVKAVGCVRRVVIGKICIDMYIYKSVDVGE